MPSMPNGMLLIGKQAANSYSMQIYTKCSPFAIINFYNYSVAESFFKRFSRLHIDISTVLQKKTKFNKSNVPLNYKFKFKHRSIHLKLPSVLNIILCVS